MFKVIIKNTEESFQSLRDAMDFAEKESYINNCSATVVTPLGKKITVKI